MLKITGYGVLAVSVLFFIVVIGINLWPSHPASPAVPYHQVIIFGDSLSDAAPTRLTDGQKGNNYWIKPNGITTYVGTPITSDFSADNTRRYLWVNYFIKQQTFDIGGHDLLIRRELVDPLATHTIINKNNVSYAVGSAQTGNNYINDKHDEPWPVIDCNRGYYATETYSCVPGLLKQVNLYLSDVQQQINPHTLFIIWIGGNDFYQNIVKITDKNNTETLSRPIRNTVKAVKLLIAHGVSADHIVVLNLPDFSLVPAIITLVDNKIENTFLQHLSLALISTISTGYNAWLKTSLVVGTGGSFSPTRVFSTEALLSGIRSNKNDIRKTLGIDKPVSESCAAAHETPLCEGFFFYNDMHPTTSIHAYLAKQLGDYLSGPQSMDKERTHNNFGPLTQEVSSLPRRQ